MQIKRQLFRPGRRIEQIGRLATHPFFARRKRSPASASAGVSSSEPAGPRGFLPRMAENAGALFSITISFTLVAALAALMFAFVRDIRRDAFELDSFTTPREIADRGYTSTAIAEAILDEIRTIQVEAFTLQARRQLEVAATLPDVQVAGAGLSMKAIVRYARRLFDLPDNRINGDMFQDGKALKLALRIREGPRTQLVVVRRDDGDVDRLLKDAGRALVQIADPQLLAVYLYGHEVAERRFTATRAAIDYILAHGSSEDRGRAYQMLGTVQRLEGEPENALASYRRFAAIDRSTGSLAVIQQLVRMGRDEEALALARQRVSLAATASDWGVASAAMSSLGLNSQAIDYARRSLARDPKGADAHNTLGFTLYTVHRAREGAAVAERGFQLNPTDKDLASTLAFLLAAVGRAPEAIEICNASLAEWPGDLYCREARGDAYASLGRVDEAIAEYRYAQTNGNPSAYLATHFGDLLLANGKPSEALVQYESALTNEPQNWMAQTGWARAQLALGRPKVAVQRFTTIAPNDPDNVQLYTEWARALDMLGRKDEAQAKREEADKARARLDVPLPAS
jgi:tetratricopeptide (TPR) repeat protein